MAPGEICFHGTLCDLIPGTLSVIVDFLRIADRTQHLMSIVIGEGESGSGLLILIVRLHGIFQSTGLTKDVYKRQPWKVLNIRLN